MKGFIGLTKRNLLIYFKDIQSVLFSLLTSIIVFVLYLLFLKGNFTDAIAGAMEGLEDIVAEQDIEILVNGILLVGVLGSALITVPYNCLSTIVRDREQKIDYDISATPLKRWQVILSYFISSALSAFLITGIILTVGLFILSALGSLYMNGWDILAAYGVILLGSVSATAFFMILVLFFQSSSASGAFFGMLSAAAGFVIGAYIPVSQFAEGVRTFCNLFPASQVTILCRNVLLNGVLEHINTAVNGLDGGMFAESMRSTFTFQAELFGRLFNRTEMVVYVTGVMVVCIGVMIVVYARTYKRK